jgi:hypothetical protein
MRGVQECIPRIKCNCIALPNVHQFAYQYFTFSKFFNIEADFPTGQQIWELEVDVRMREAASTWNRARCFRLQALVSVGWTPNVILTSTHGQQNKKKRSYGLILRFV